ncbi:small ribosomal subunit Rsm22 family protein [Aestuariivirga sp.]|uniref:small ribosomal subunit Rsm22 family protein n=1 Tax=Aestuariivirga sp. TaxID=2650926 RepID=UPI00391B99BD
MSLSGAFGSAIATWLAAHGGAGGRRQASAALSATYRAGGGSQSIDLASYLVARLPATYAAVSRVLEELRKRRPGFHPLSLLDAGSGPGTASWAAAGLWPSLSAVTFLDNSPSFLALARELAKGGPEPLASAAAVAGTILALPAGVAADLVVAAYALAELPLARAAAAAEGLWASSRSVLVLVEPGTPHGFARIRAARDTLLAQGAVPVAPCPHALGCPIAGEDWCHFSVRLARSRAHLHAKGALVPFEDERYAYLILAREGDPTGGARILAPPEHAKPGSSFRLCTHGSTEIRYIARRSGAAYKLAKKLGWGDLMAPEKQEEEGS